MRVQIYTYLWIAILILALSLRLYGLNLNPVGMSHDDELHELINAKSLALTGSHAPGRVAGILTQNDKCPGNCVYGELGSYILIPWMLIFPLDIFWAKIPFVLASIGLVFFTGKLFENLSRNPKIGLLAGLLMAINPWSIHFGRTAYFTTFSYTFYIIAAYFFTRNKSYKIDLTAGTFFSIIASLFYFGTKPILPLIVIWGVIYNLYKSKLKQVKFALLILSVTFLFIAGYFLILNNSYAGRRLQEIGKVDVNMVKDLVNQQRQVSLEIPLIRDLMINKFGVQANIITEKYLSFLNPVFLYLRSEGSTDIYYISNHGYYYLIDLPFLIFGFLAVATYLPTALFLLLLIMFSSIPAALKIAGDTIYALRVGLVYPILTGITGWGIYFCYDKISSLKKYAWIKKLHLSFMFIAVITLSYILSVAYFMIMYWYRTPIDKNIGWYFHKRIVAGYITRLQSESDRKVVVISAQPDATFNTYVFFSGFYNNKETVEEINKSYSLRTYQFKNARFTNDCSQITDQDLADSTIFIEQGMDCHINLDHTDKIANPRDSGGMYDIINESLCSKFPRDRYPYPRYITDFKVEDLTKNRFCKIWITNPDKI